jgi:hypothetical protein
MILRSLVMIFIICLALLLFARCATLQNLIGQTPLQTYTFNYDGKDFSAFLPEQVPMPPETARQVPQSYWDIIYAMHVQYFAGKQPHPALPCASFWFTLDLGVIGLAWHTLEPDGTVKHQAWLYIKGIPIGTTEEIFDKMLEDLFTKPNTPGA